MRRRIAGAEIENHLGQCRHQCNSSESERQRSRLKLQTTLSSEPHPLWNVTMKIDGTRCESLPTVGQVELISRRSEALAKCGVAGRGEYEGLI